MKSPQAAARSSAPAQAMPQDYATVFTNAKAGMAGVDKEHVKRVVYEMSKDSPHFKNEQRKQEQTNARIQKMLQRKQQLSPSELAGHARAMDKKLVALKSSQDLSRTWLHADMDSFYASVEELDDPSLKSKPMAVGGLGMVCTANYAARKFGVRAAMPGFIGRKLCPELVFCKPNFAKYTAAAEKVRAIIAVFDPDYESASLDEAYMDITSYCQLHSTTGAEVATELRRRVREGLSLTCSCGVAPNRMLAKICSDLNKPDGQMVLQTHPTQLAQFVSTLPVRKVPGIGRVAEQTLAALGVTTCADLIEQRGLLGALYSSVSTDYFMAAGLGIGATQHSELAEGEVGRKGMSCERTFATISETADLYAKLEELAEKLAADLAAKDLKGKTLTLKLKATTFEVRTRAATLGRYFNDLDTLLATARTLLQPELPIEIRLMGLRMSGFLEVRVEPGQRSIAAFMGQAGSRGLQQQDTAAAEDQLDVGADDDNDAAALHQELGAAEVAASAVPRGASPAQLEESSAAAPSSRAQGDSRSGRVRPATWQCQLCTFAGNDAKWLRCEVCDNVRGSSLACTNAHQQQQQQQQAEAADTEDTAGGRGRLTSLGAGGQRATRGESAQQPSYRTQLHAQAADEPTASAGKQTARDAGGDSTTFVCPECQQQLSRQVQQEHADWHYALKLQGPQRLAAAAPAPRPAPTAKRKRGSSGPSRSILPANMATFLKRQQ